MCTVFGQCLGSATTGLALGRCVDPDGRTSAFDSFGVASSIMAPLAAALVAVMPLLSLKIEIGMPVYCRGVVPDDPWKNGPGEVNTPVCIGGRVVNPGDIVVADSDGVVIIRPEDADDVYEKVQKLMQGEATALKKIAESGEMIRPWVMEKLNALGCEFYEKYEG